ncbi:MAG: hypothetical protein ACFB5Z_02965 [Elainellaceae cyanobacterium]
MLRRPIAALTASLISGLLGWPAASPARPALLAQSPGDTCGQTTGSTIIYDQPRRDAPIVAQIVQAGRRLSLDPNFSTGDWVRVTTASVAGFTLVQYLDSCGASSGEGAAVSTASTESASTGGTTAADDGTVGSCAIALPDRSAPQLSVRVEAGANAAYNAIAAGSGLILSAEPALYSPEQERYWREVLAYPPQQGSRSATGEAWISETGADTPRLLHNSDGILVNRQGEAYPNLNIARRPCQTLFPDASIVEGQSLPTRLPEGYRTP